MYSTLNANLCQRIERIDHSKWLARLDKYKSYFYIAILQCKWWWLHSRLQEENLRAVVDLGAGPMEHQEDPEDPV